METAHDLSGAGPALAWPDRPPSPRSGPVVAIGLAAIVLLVAGLTAVAVTASRAPAPSGAVLGGRVQPHREGVGGEPRGVPLRIRIPAIEVSASFVSLGLNDDGTLEVPPFERAGWWTGGALPGTPGPAVVAAHLDTTEGPAVFYRLDDLDAGDLILIDYWNTTVAFKVGRSASFAKSDFPTREVYGTTSAPELRLITCDGSFDRRVHSYQSNLVVWASLA